MFKFCKLDTFYWKTWNKGVFDIDLTRLLTIWFRLDYGIIGEKNVITSKYIINI